ncbi:MAG: DUF3644 domain-containing protein [Xanthobacteraceae bacterium]|uniref:DUF3644 domain-containing protein n=1 Tax=Pseudolabrys sp. TaxID=1960880 RepID=UPI003D0A8C9E
MARKLYSEKRDLILKAREAMLSAVQIYNNPLISFKTESFIVLSIIAWTYLLHAHFRANRIEYRYFTKKGQRKRFVRNADGSIRYWDLKECVSKESAKLDIDTKNNLEFLIGLRNQVEHKKAAGLDSYLSARYQACALNFNFYLKKLHGDKFGLDHNLALSLQFAELDQSQEKIIKDKEDMIPKGIISYISAFDSRLSTAEIESQRFAYRLLFVRVAAKRKGQADRVIEFIDPNSELAQNISREYWVKEETERPKLSATQVVKKVRSEGFSDFGMHQHTLFWKEHDGKNPARGFGTMVVKSWYWYQHWPTFIISELSKLREKSPRDSTETDAAIFAS